ncbi:MAG: hypothetical protein O7G31_11755 [Calditrichaeota bacterium]|nr:hypothetical protein [Calditrichota bacterium]
MKSYDMGTQAELPETTKSLPAEASLFHFLRVTSQAIHSGLQLEDFLSKLAEAIHQVLPVSALAISKYDAVSASLHTVYSGGAESTSGDGKLSPNLADEAVANKQVVWENVHNQNASSGLMAAPLLSHGRVSGIIQVRSDRLPYHNQHSEALYVISSVVALVLDNFWQKDGKPETDKLSTRDRKLAVLETRNKKLFSVVELARSIAHELNQPLTGISGYCALIKEELAEGHPITKDVDEIQKQALRLEQLIHKFQNAAHVEYRENSRDNSG